MGPPTSCSALFCTVLQLMSPAPWRPLSSPDFPCAPSQLPTSFLSPPSHRSSLESRDTISCSKSFPGTLMTASVYSHASSADMVSRQGQCSSHDCTAETQGGWNRASSGVTQGCVLSWVGESVILVLNYQEVWGRFLGRAALGSRYPELHVLPICSVRVQACLPW